LPETAKQVWNWNNGELTLLNQQIIKSTNQQIILSTAYLPSLRYMGKFLHGGTVLLEAQEHYQKQSYRNRCYIYGANGKQCLVIPVMGGSEGRQITEVEIDYRMNWQKIHLKSIESAYRTSAFYEFYSDDIQTMYSEKTPLLFDWNHNLMTWLLRALTLNATVGLTTTYEKNPAGITDLRQGIHPKPRYVIPDPHFSPLPYQQVFIERFGFLPDLSTIDLLFNEGPQAGDVLRGCTQY